MACSGLSGSIANPSEGDTGFSSITESHGGTRDNAHAGSHMANWLENPVLQIPYM